MELLILARLRKLNYWTAMTIGMVLALCTCFILLDIFLRQIGSSLGGSEEISGYVMAIVTSWGMSYTLLELSHVRIDFLRSKLESRVQALMDVIAMAAMTATVCFIAFRSWAVVYRSIVNNAHANTVLETPLTWVQVPWFAGWVWFAVVAVLTLLAALSLILKGEIGASEDIIGLQSEGDDLK